MNNSINAKVVNNMENTERTPGKIAHGILVTTLFICPFVAGYFVKSHGVIGAILAFFSVLYWMYIAGTWELDKLAKVSYYEYLMRQFFVGEVFLSLLFIFFGGVIVSESHFKFDPGFIGTFVSLYVVLTWFRSLFMRVSPLEKV